MKWKPETSPNPFGLQADVRNTNDPHAEFALRHDPANSRAIGYSTTQQNTAYAAAVRAPELSPGHAPKRTDSVCGSTTTWGTTRKPSGTDDWIADWTPRKNDMGQTAIIYHDTQPTL